MSKPVTESEAVMRLKARLRYATYLIITTEKCDFNQISVSNLAETAKISRATFYNYYDSIEDFSEETLKYLVDIVIKQAVKFLSDGRGKLKSNCKQENLIIPPGDRMLISAFACLVSFELIEYSLPVAHESFLKYVENDLLSEEFVSKNKKTIGFFIFGFSKTIFKSLVKDPNGKKMYKSVVFSFDLWNDLFPEHKL